MTTIRYVTENFSVLLNVTWAIRYSQGFVQLSESVNETWSEPFTWVRTNLSSLFHSKQTQSYRKNARSSFDNTLYDTSNVYTIMQLRLTLAKCPKAFTLFNYFWKNPLKGQGKLWWAIRDFRLLFTFSSCSTACFPSKTSRNCAKLKSLSEAFSPKTRRDESLVWLLI